MQGVQGAQFCSVRLCKDARRYERRKRLEGLIRKSAPKLENLSVLVSTITPPAEPASLPQRLMNLAPNR